MSAAKKKPAPVPQKVVSLDGGGITSLLNLTVLRRLEDKRPGFLKSVDLFVGTGAGGINAMLLAGSDDPAEMLDTCTALWDGRLQEWQTSMWRSFRMLDGSVSVYDNAHLQEHLEELFEDRCLSDLAKGVAVVALDVTGRDTGCWSPVVFTNRGPGRFYGETLSAVATGLASFAAPMTFPIAGGYIDGSLFAKNPSLAALTELIAIARSAEQPGPILHAPSMHHRFEAIAESGAKHLEGPATTEMLAPLRLLSLGCGTNPQRIEELDAGWGWRQWLGDMRDPALIFQVAEDAVERTADLACQQMLGTRGYHRVQPHMAENIHPSHDLGAGGNQTAIRRVIELSTAAGETVDLQPALDWLDAGGWG
jgi:predicted acylesterase/phospholipase RssA